MGGVHTRLVRSGFGEGIGITVIIWEDVRIVCLCGGARRWVVTASDWRSFCESLDSIITQVFHVAFKWANKNRLKWAKIGWCRVEWSSRFSFRLLLYSTHAPWEKSENGSRFLIFPFLLVVLLLKERPNGQYSNADPKHLPHKFTRRPYSSSKMNAPGDNPKQSNKKKENTQYDCPYIPKRCRKK